MTQEEAKRQVLEAWHVWAKSKRFTVHPGGTDGTAFFEHVRATRPDLLKFKHSGDKWALVHGWLLSGAIQSHNATRQLRAATQKGVGPTLRKVGYSALVGSIIGGWGAILLAAVVSKLLNPFCGGGRFQEEIFDEVLAGCGRDDIIVSLGRIFVGIGIPLAIWHAWASLSDDYEEGSQRDWAGKGRVGRILTIVCGVIGVPVVAAGWLLTMAPIALLLNFR